MITQQIIRYIGECLWVATGCKNSNMLTHDYMPMLYVYVNKCLSNLAHVMQFVK